MVAEPFVVSLVVLLPGRLGSLLFLLAREVAEPSSEEDVLGVVLSSLLVRYDRR